MANQKKPLVAIHSNTMKNNENYNIATIVIVTIKAMLLLNSNTMNNPW